MKLYAYAKINLFLDVRKKRADGYHEMEMLMQSISLCDKLEMEISRHTCVYPFIENNIVDKAVQLFLATTEIKSGIDIHVSKSIPMQAGLGGGSADGAACLLGLDRLFDTRLGKEKLRDMALELGCDLPFCMEGGARFVEGVGERLTPTDTVNVPYIVIVKPDFHVCTREAFGQLDQTGYESDGSRFIKLKKYMKKNPFDAHCVYNAFNYQDRYKQYIEKMIESGAAGANISGSGSAVFGLFYEEKSAKKAAGCFGNLETFITKPINYGIKFI